MKNTDQITVLTWEKRDFFKICDGSSIAVIKNNGKETIGRFDVVRYIESGPYDYTRDLGPNYTIAIPIDNTENTGSFKGENNLVQSGNKLYKGVILPPVIGIVKTYKEGILITTIFIRKESEWNAVEKVCKNEYFATSPNLLNWRNGNSMIREFSSDKKIIRLEYIGENNGTTSGGIKADKNCSLT